MMFPVQVALGTKSSSGDCVLMTHSHLYDRGALRPAQLAVLERVFDDACRLHSLDRHSEEARELALRILALFNAGMVGEADLRDVIAFERERT